MHSELEHPHAMQRRCDGMVLVRRDRRGHKQHLIETETLLHPFGNAEMPDVHRIEGSPQKGNFLWHNN